MPRGIFPRTPEYIEKLRLSALGRKHSEESKKKMSIVRKGNIPWNKGKTDVYSKETLEKMSKSNLGKKRTLETRKKMSKAKKELLKDPTNHYMFGRLGEDNPKTICSEKESIVNGNILRWKKWKLFRDKILKRDNYICNHCKEKANEIHHKKSRKLYPKLCFNKKNVISLCTSCHAKLEHKLRDN